MFQLNFCAGWGVFPASQLFPKLACFSMASGWGISPVFQLLPQLACFPDKKKTRQLMPTRFAGEKNWFMKPMYIIQQI